MRRICKTGEKPISTPQAEAVDVLTVTGGLVTAIWVVADDLGLLRQLDAAKLNG